MALDVSVRIRYQGEKKRIISDSNLHIAIDILRSDLLRLKIPHPKIENVNIIHPGCIQFSWRTQRGSTLHRQLVQRVRPDDRELTDALHISTMTLQERIVTQPFINGASPSPKKSRSRPRPSVYENMVDVSRSPSYDVDTCGSSERDVKSIRMKEEAQKLLDSVMSDHTGNSSASTLPRPSSSQSTFPSSVLSDSAVPFPTTTPQPSFSFPPMLPAASLPPSAQNTSISAPRPPVKSASDLSTPAVGSSSLNHPPESPHLANPSTSSPAAYTGSSLHPLPMKPEPASGPPPARSISRWSRGDAVSHPPSPHTFHPVYLGEVPRPEDIPTINRLTRELWDMRRQITAAVAQEVGILAELKRLKAPNTPDVSSLAQAKSAALGNGSVTQRRLGVVELEMELQDERRKRAEAEQLVKDVERECREPFVVPALLDAFVAISSLSGDVRP